MIGSGYSLVVMKVQRKANGRVTRRHVGLRSATRLVWIWLIVVSAVVSVGLLACETAEPTPIEPTRVPSATAAPVVRVEPTAAPTATQLPTVTPSPTVTPTVTQLPTVTPSPAVTPTATRTVGPTPTLMPVATDTPEPTPTETMSPTPTSVATATATPVLTDTPTATVVSSPTDTVEPEPEATVTPTSVATPTPTAIVEVERVVEVVVVATVIVGPKLPDDFVAPPVRRSGLFPAITTISESDIEELQANRSQVYRFRSNPVPIGEVLTVSNWSMRLVAVERTEPGAGSVCRAETGEVCLRIEF